MTTRNATSYREIRYTAPEFHTGLEGGEPLVRKGIFIFPGASSDA